MGKNECQSSQVNRPQTRSTRSSLKRLRSSEEIENSDEDNNLKEQSSSSSPLNNMKDGMKKSANSGDETKLKKQQNKRPCIENESKEKNVRDHESSIITNSDINDKPKDSPRSNQTDSVINHKLVKTIDDDDDDLKSSNRIGYNICTCPRNVLHCIGILPAARIVTSMNDSDSEPDEEDDLLSRLLPPPSERPSRSNES